MARSVMLLLAVGFCLAADNGPDAVRKEYGRFEGTWRFTAIEVEGMKTPPEYFKGARMICHGDQFTVKEPTATYRGTFHVDVSKKPKQIDVAFAEGPDKGKTLLGIYELEGDTYRVCIGLTGRSRPTEFASKPGSGHVLEVLKREKAGPAKGAESKSEK
jgi:uncharacterized protein (TIGR03067 family)